MPSLVVVVGRLGRAGRRWAAHGPPLGRWAGGGGVWETCAAPSSLDLQEGTYGTFHWVQYVKHAVL